MSSQKCLFPRGFNWWWYFWILLMSFKHGPSESRNLCCSCVEKMHSANKTLLMQDCIRCYPILEMPFECSENYLNTFPKLVLPFPCKRVCDISTRPGTTSALRRVIDLIYWPYVNYSAMNASSSTNPYILIEVAFPRVEGWDGTLAKARPPCLLLQVSVFRKQVMW